MPSWCRHLRLPSKVSITVLLAFSDDGIPTR
jgi:hypothetical protein